MLIPKTIRKWIAVFRGDVAPALVFLSAMLGIWFGMTPGLYGIHAALLIVALVVNIHFGIFMLTAGLGKAMCLAAAPLLYHVGAWTQNNFGGLLDLLASIPILGITNVSRYAVAGSLVVGPVVGIIAGLLLTFSVQRFRTSWLSFEEGSEAFNRWMNKGWVKLLARIFVGKGSASAADVLNKRPKYVRVAGVILAVVVAGGAVVGASMINGDTLIAYAEQSLTNANGAQVDIKELDLGMMKGRVTVSDIAATNPEQPNQNRLEIATLTADISLWELLCGRIVMEEVAIATVKMDSPRNSAGEVVQSAKQAKVSPEKSSSMFDKMGLDLGSVATAESYFSNAEQVRSYLRKLQEWLPSSEKTETEEIPTAAVPTAYLEYLDATAPRSPTPRLVIRKLVIDDVIIPVEGLGNSKIVCLNLSDAPAGLGKPVVIEATSKENKSTIKLTSTFKRGGGSSTVDALFEDIDLANMQKNLNRSNPVVLQGGQATAKISGSINREFMDIGFAISTVGLKMNAAGGIGGLDPQVSSEAMKVLENLDIGMRLVGPTASPKLVIDSKGVGQAMQEALVNAGKDELARRAGDLLEGKIPDGVPDLKDGLPSLGDSQGALKGLFGKKSSDKPASQSTEKKKSAGKKNDLKNQAEKAFGGLFGKKKKKD